MSHDILREYIPAYFDDKKAAVTCVLLLVYRESLKIYRLITLLINHSLLLHNGSSLRRITMFNYESTQNIFVYNFNFVSHFEDRHKLCEIKHERVLYFILERTLNFFKGLVLLWSRSSAYHLLTC